MFQLFSPFAFQSFVLLSFHLSSYAFSATEISIIQEQTKNFKFIIDHRYVKLKENKEKKKKIAHKT